MTERPKTAGIIIIGNEILSGKVRDLNSFFLSQELRDLGVVLLRISVIPDDVTLIGKEVVECSSSFDFVFTSGGVGPTHDDVTMEGIAGGFGVRIVSEPELVRHLMSYCGGKANAAVLKMAEVPEGSEIIDPGNAGFPIVSFRNVYIFPGIPQYLTRKFSAIKERFRCSPFYLKRLYLCALESEIAATLNEVVAENGDVTFGSYPVLDNPEYKIIVTAESQTMESVTRSVDDLVRRLPKEIIVRVETGDSH